MPHETANRKNRRACSTIILPEGCRGDDEISVPDGVEETPGVVFRCAALTLGVPDPKGVLRSE